jgi:hypothetical protein
MADKKADKKELKALERLIKGVHMGVTAYDAAAEGVADKQLRKQYATFRSTHERQLHQLQGLYADRGGDLTRLNQRSPLEFLPFFKEKATGPLPTYESVDETVRGEGMGIKNITDHIGDLGDEAANVAAQHMRENEGIVQWLHHYVRAGEKKQSGGGLPLPLLLVIGLVASFVVFLLRDQDEDDDDDILREEYLQPVSQG